MITALGLSLGLICAPSGPGGQEQRPAASIDWQVSGFEPARGLAAQRRQPLFIYVWMEGSAHCVNLYTQTLETPQGAAALAGHVCLSAQAGTAAGAEVVGRFGVTTLPTMLFLDAAGEVEDALLGDIALSRFVSEVARIESGTDTLRDFRRRAAAAPDDLDLRFLLADKLLGTGHAAAGQALIASIRRDDPEGKTVIGAQLALYDLMNGITAAASDPGDPTTYDLGPMYRHLPGVQPSPVRFEGWQWVAGIEGQRGNRAERRRALAETWPHVALASRLNWGRELVRNYWDERDELDRKERRFVLTVAEAVTARAEELVALDKPPPGAFGEGFEGDTNAFLANQLDGLACALFLNGKRARAIATVERSLSLDPGVAAHRALLDQFSAER